MELLISLGADTMTLSINKILGLKKLDPSDAAVRFGFALEIPLWGWVFIALACGFAAAWCYWRLMGPRGARVSLGIVRWLLLLLIVFLIAGPQFVRQEERTERDWVVVMADRSASMTLQDANAAGLEPQSRDRQLSESLRKAWPMFERLHAERELLYLGFDSAIYELRRQPYAGPGTGGLVLGDPLGGRTNIGQSLDQVLRRIAARPVAGIILLSDGRSADAPGRQQLKQLESRQIPVYAVPLGSERSPPDLAIARVEAPSAAFLNDIVPVNVDVEALGDIADRAAGGTIELIDKATGEVLDRQPLGEPAAAGQPRRITLAAKPGASGQLTWTVRLVPDGADLSAENNTSDLRIELMDKPIRVVYFDGYPRWEYRYLKNLLLRERSIRSAALLLSADKKFLQEGSELLDFIPRTAAGWSPIDVLVIGDMRPELLSEEQMRQVAEHVAQRGGGLLWIGGPSSTPTAWRNTPLADLLPFRIAAESDSVSEGGGQVGPPAYADPVVITPSPAAERLGLLNLGENVREPWPAALSDPESGWSVLQYAQQIDARLLKPTVESLAFVAPVGAATRQPDLSRRTPLVLTMRYGAGRVVYVATDEIWRYRFGRGEALPERFWLPIIRLLARDSLGRGGKAASLEAAPTQARVEQPVQITLRLLDQALVERRPTSVVVRVSPSGRSELPAAEVELRPENATVDASAAPVSSFTGSWIASEPGVFTIDSQDPALAGAEVSAQVQVILADDELRTPQTDHALLTSLAASTGGKVIAPGELASVEGLLPNRQLRVLGTPEAETLWDKPVVWILLMTLLTLEWIGRRLIKLP